MLAALHRANRERVFVALAPTPQDATSAEADLETVLGGPGASHLYPQKEALPYEESEPHLEIGGLRVEAVEALFSGRTQILVTTPRALQERVPIPERLTELRRTFRTGDSTVLSELPSYLEARGFERAALVEEVGQFAVRGGILDIFSVAAGGPVRIEFWGDEIESIRSFDILDQRSTGEIGVTHVLPVDFRRSEGETDRTVASHCSSCYQPTQSSLVSGSGKSPKMSSAPGNGYPHCTRTSPAREQPTLRPPHSS